MFDQLRRRFMLGSRREGLGAPLPISTAAPFAVLHGQTCVKESTAIECEVAASTNDELAHRLGGNGRTVQELGDARARTHQPIGGCMGNEEMVLSVGFD